MKEGTTVVNTKEYFELKKRCAKLKEDLSKVLHDETIVLEHITTDDSCGIRTTIVNFYSKSDTIEENIKNIVVCEKLRNNTKEIKRKTEKNNKVNSSMIFDLKLLTLECESEIERLKNRSLYQRIFNF